MGGGLQAVKERNVEPLIVKAGEDLLSVNNVIYRESERIINDGGIQVKLGTEKDPNSILSKFKRWWATLKSLSGLIWANIYFIWWIAILVIIAGKLSNNTSASIGAFVFGLILLFSVSGLYGAYYIYPQLEEEIGQPISMGTKLNPFNGWFKMAEAAEHFKPIFVRVEKTLGKTQDQTNKTAAPVGYVT